MFDERFDALTASHEVPDSDTLHLLDEERAAWWKLPPHVRRQRERDATADLAVEWLEKPR